MNRLLGYYQAAAEAADRHLIRYTRRQATVACPTFPGSRLAAAAQTGRRS